MAWKERPEIPDNQTLRIPAEVSNAYTVSAHGAKVMAFVCAFSATPLPSACRPALKRGPPAPPAGRNIWNTGGAIDLSASKDARWKELERRIVLSQYLMAAMSAGSWPSSENGLLGIDPWRGQFHMEMVWWHLAHYALWDRWDQADKALGCYRRFAPAARELAAQLGYKGLKWQKSVGPEGRTAPWVGNQVLLWKQPHPIFFAELEYRLRPTRATLDKWADIVQGTAEHMADYPTKDETTGIYSLTPAMPPSEQGITRDTVFDLAYWRWGLDKAQEWRQRLGLAREPHWDEVRRNLAPLPVVDGVFVHSAEWTDTYTKRAWEHPDPVGVLGMLPPDDGRGCRDRAADGRQGLADLGLESLLGLGFSLDGHVRSAHRPAADRRGRPAQGYSQEQLFHRGDQWRLVSARQRRSALCRGDDGCRLGRCARQTGSRFPG